MKPKDVEEELENPWNLIPENLLALVKTYLMFRCFK
jgi:hypothetical protein